MIVPLTKQHIKWFRVVKGITIRQLRNIVSEGIISGKVTSRGGIWLDETLLADFKPINPGAKAYQPNLAKPLKAIPIDPKDATANTALPDEYYEADNEADNEAADEAGGAPPTENTLDNNENELAQEQLAELEAELTEKEERLNAREEEVNAREEEVKEREQAVKRQEQQLDEMIERQKERNRQDNEDVAEARMQLEQNKQAIISHALNERCVMCKHRPYVYDPKYTGENKHVIVIGGK